MLKNIRDYAGVTTFGKGTLEAPMIIQYTKDLELRFRAGAGWGFISHIMVEGKNRSSGRAVAEAEAEFD